MSFFEELKRRKVFRVAASYAVVAFVIMQLVEIVFPIFDFPQWTSQYVIIIVLLGFPIAIVLSWIFDKTPEGFIKTDLQQKEEVGGIADNRPFYQQKRNVCIAFPAFQGFGQTMGVTPSASSGPGKLIDILVPVNQHLLKIIIVITMVVICMI